MEHLQLQISSLCLSTNEKTSSDTRELSYELCLTLVHLITPLMSPVPHQRLVFGLTVSCEFFLMFSRLSLSVSVYLSFRPPTLFLRMWPTSAPNKTRFQTTQFLPLTGCFAVSPPKMISKHPPESFGCICLAPLHFCANGDNQFYESALEVLFKPKLSYT